MTIQEKPAPEAARSTVRMSVDARGLALGILATVAVVFVLQWAQSFVISVLVGIFFAYTLNPLVVWLERIKIPRVLGAGIVLAAVVSALVLGTYSLRGQIQTILEQVPEAASKVSAGLASLRRGQPGNIQKMQTAAREIEKAASQAADSPSTSRQPAMHVVIDQPPFKLGSFLLVGSMGALGFMAEAAMVLFLVFFLLLAGDTFKRKLVRLTGPLLSNKKITVRILDDINDTIQKYMFMLLMTNVLVGLLTWIALRWIGLENAGAWAVAAGLLHVIPYLGPSVTAAATGLVAFMQFDSFSVALLVAGTSLAIATVVGTFITTWMTGRIAKMNAAAVFISLLFWAWLWGVWGMLLSIPIIVMVKVVAQHVEQLQPVAELLGE
ncbi:MAG TPA: AI-2E family transporter [Candidatus Polarisedimenticolia bacterium]|nr:AI-2E family transporter [Candidatus Polarisedimenticolia bacterium]